MTDYEVFCHGSDADGDGNQQSCPEMAWCRVPWRSVQGQGYRIPLCWKHTWLFLIRDQERERAR